MKFFSYGEYASIEAKSYHRTPTAIADEVIG